MSSSSLFLVVKTPVLLADFVRRADRRGTSERTSGGKAVTGATGSIFHRMFCVKSIFELFLGGLRCFTRFTPEFRLFSRSGRNRRNCATNSPERPETLRLLGTSPRLASRGTLPVLLQAF